MVLGVLPFSGPVLAEVLNPEELKRLREFIGTAPSP
jgi:hypothetical protein